MKLDDDMKIKIDKFNNEIENNCTSIVHIICKCFFGLPRTKIQLNACDLDPKYYIK